MIICHKHTLSLVSFAESLRMQIKFSPTKPPMLTQNYNGRTVVEADEDSPTSVGVIGTIHSHNR